MNACPAGLRCVSLFFLPPQAALANLGNSYLLYQQSYVVKSNDTVVYRISPSTIKERLATPPPKKNNVNARTQRI